MPSSSSSSFPYALDSAADSLYGCIVAISGFLTGPSLAWPLAAANRHLWRHRLSSQRRQTDRVALRGPAAASVRDPGCRPAGAARRSRHNTSNNNVKDAAASVSVEEEADFGNDGSDDDAGPRSTQRDQLRRGLCRDTRCFALLTSRNARFRRPKLADSIGWWFRKS